MMFRVSRSRCSTHCASVCLLGWLLAWQTISAQTPQPIPDPTAQLDFAKDIKPILQKYCFDCHSGKEPEGKIALDTLDPNGGNKVRAAWKRVFEYVEGSIMPPADAPALPGTPYKKLVAWLQAKPLQLDCSGPVHPGRVTIRRLNRVEYNNTIRDLCGVDFKPAKDFPSDDIGYGFDNNGDVLSLPPLLLEKYLEAAEAVATKAIVVFDESSAPVQRYKGRELGSVDAIQMEYNFAQAGEYILRAKAAADQAGPEQARMEFRLDDQEVKTFEIPGKKREAFRNFDHKLRVSAGKHTFSAGFLNDYYQPNHADVNMRGDRNLYIDRLEIVGPIGVRPADMPASHTQIIYVEPNHQLSPTDAAKKIMQRFASRAFRRPAQDDEVKRLVAIYELARQNGDSFERGIQVAMQAVLASPHFLFRVEQEPTQKDKNGIRLLNEYELATRLSYFLWSTMPDAELFSLAHQGKLRKNLRSQMERMLRDEKSRALVDNFAGQWLQLRTLERVSPNAQRFPSWNEDLRRDMRQETELFFHHIVKEDRSVLEFMTAEYSFLNERLAKHYGIEGVLGNEFRQVALPKEQRGGVLGHASILTVTSNPGRTSPVKRGKWILENLLASPPPPAPPNVPALEESRKAAEQASLRVRLEMHRSNPACNACHKVLDPLGFAFENYDAIGAWRTKDGKFNIDPAGVLPDGQKFSSVSELRAILSQREDDFRRCLAEKLLTYAIGRGLEGDECTIRHIAQVTGEQQNKFSAFIWEVINSDQFQKRAATRNDYHE